MKNIISLLIFPFFSFLMVHRAAAQHVNSDSLIQQYCKAHKLAPAKSASGLYYIIKQAGNGQPVKDSVKVIVNYKGSLMDGTVFDSNMKRKFHHKVPFQYWPGAGQIIKGFDEGDKLLHEGGSAILIIPPTLGYGDKDLKVIPPNSILIFEVHILKVESKPGC
jgi:FKBP-type peptidyl-prolyl cis-trans isomerase FkpA